ncbi:MAG: hypothetical protein ACM3O3_11435 [Syntrophothermus sp.]
MTRYSYSYDKSKLASATETTYIIMFGQVVDTMVTLTNYEYDSKGLLKRESSKTDGEEIPSLQLYDYNPNDSLIREITLSPENDTTYWTEYNYFPDGRKMVFRRTLFLHHDPDQDFLKQMENKQFDTTYYRIVYKYENNLCRSSEEYDKNNNLTKITEYDYKDGRIEKATHFSKVNGIEVTDKIQYFDYSKSESQPDYYTLDLNNDTIEYCKSMFINHLVSTRTDVLNNGKMVNRTFFENGKEIGFIGIDKTMNFKIVESNSYYENGDLKEKRSYHEEIKNSL